jgi:hypothetical protein
LKKLAANRETHPVPLQAGALTKCREVCEGYYDLIPPSDSGARHGVRKRLQCADWQRVSRNASGETVATLKKDIGCKEVGNCPSKMHAQVMIAQSCNRLEANLSALVDQLRDEHQRDMLTLRRALEDTKRDLSKCLVGKSGERR